MRLNLGCGPDIKPGYTNVDFRQLPGVDRVVDLSSLPWPFPDRSASEILMYDFLEHFSYRKTDEILQEVHRILEPQGFVEVQVPDFEHCARAVLDMRPFLCNRCGEKFEDRGIRPDHFVCSRCGQPQVQCATAAMERIFGGQDYEGNWHQTSFTTTTLSSKLKRIGFVDLVDMTHEKNQNGETFYQNWNIKIKASKKHDLWGDDV